MRDYKDPPRPCPLCFPSSHLFCRLSVHHFPLPPSPLWLSEALKLTSPLPRDVVLSHTTPRSLSSLPRLLVLIRPYPRADLPSLTISLRCDRRRAGLADQIGGGLILPDPSVTSILPRHLPPTLVISRLTAFSSGTPRGICPPGTNDVVLIRQFAAPLTTRPCRPPC